MRPFGANPKWSLNMKTWREARVVKEEKDGKTGDCGIDMMFVGCSMNCEFDSVQMWNSGTNQVVMTRDIVWLRWMSYSHTTEYDTIYIHPNDNDEKPCASEIEEDKADDAANNDTVAINDANNGDDEEKNA